MSYAGPHRPTQNVLLSQEQHNALVAELEELRAWDIRKWFAATKTLGALSHEDGWTLMPTTMAHEMRDDAARLAHLIEHSVRSAMHMAAVLYEPQLVMPSRAQGEARELIDKARVVDDGKCESCAGDKCTAGPRCVTMGLDSTPTKPPQRCPACNGMTFTYTADRMWNCDNCKRQYAEGEI